MKYLLAVLVDDADLLDDNGQPLPNSAAVLQFMMADDPEFEAPPAGTRLKVASGPAAEHAFAHLVAEAEHTA